MGDLQDKVTEMKDWRLIFTKPELWEAPDRGFAGHRDIATRSLARYQFVAPYLRGTTLDIGCGRGYGFDVIHKAANSQVGIDLSSSFLMEAQKSYPTTPIVRASGDLLPFCRNSFDSITAFEVIEHIEDDVAFLHGLKRVARQPAFFAISTPNRLITSGHREKPLNPYHVREYSADEFHRVLSAVYSSVSMFGQHDSSEYAGWRNRLVDLIPVRLKYLLPAHIQGLLSITLRPALQLEDCCFRPDDLDTAHTFVALCQA